MKPRDFDPLRLDVERFAADGGRLQGQWPLAAMHRLTDACHPEAAPAAVDVVDWQAVGERRRPAGSVAQTWLHLVLTARVTLVCQRCLGPSEAPFEVDRWFRFVDGETQATALDAETEEDVLASTRALDLRQLAEDELLLALPLVPRHEVCPVPLHPAVGGSDVPTEAEPAEHPFAALAGLRRPPH